MTPRQYLDTLGLFSHNPLNGVGLWPEEMDLLVSLLPQKDYVYLETGSWNGGSLLLSHYHRTANNLKGIDIGVDPNFSPYFDLNMNRAGCKTIQYGGNKVKFTGTAKDAAKLEYELFVDDPITIDVLYIDAYHSFRNILEDYYAFKPYLTKNATIIFHDTSPRLQKPEQRQEILKWTLDNLDYLKNLDYEDFFCDEAVCYLEHTEPVEHIDCSIECYHPNETGLTSWIRGKTSPHSAIAAFRFKG